MLVFYFPRKILCVAFKQFGVAVIVVVVELAVAGLVIAHDIINHRNDCGRQGVCACVMCVFQNTGIE